MWTGCSHDEATLFEHFVGALRLIAAIALMYTRFYTCCKDDNGDNYGVNYYHGENEREGTYSRDENDYELD
jgi:heme A synthase